MSAELPNAWTQLLRFGIVGGLGVFVNMATLVLEKLLFPLVWASADPEGIWYDLPFTDYNIRWYHVMVMGAFLVANLFNFQLNRWWTFQSQGRAPWWREYLPFLLVGLVALGVGQVVITALMHAHSPVSLPIEVFDNSTWWRTRVYWANLIMIAVTVPISFLLNKYWTFSSVLAAKSTVSKEVD